MLCVRWEVVREGNECDWAGRFLQERMRDAPEDDAFGPGVGAESGHELIRIDVGESDELLGRRSTATYLPGGE